MIIDDRLFNITPSPDPSAGYIITPIIINDNLIDLTIKPALPGDMAEVDWRPKTSVYQVQSNVKTAPPGTPTQIEVDSNNVNGITTITLKGRIASDNGPIVRTQQVEDPSSFARSLLIEALE